MFEVDGRLVWREATIYNFYFLWWIGIEKYKFPVRRQTKHAHNNKVFKVA